MVRLHPQLLVLGLALGASLHCGTERLRPLPGDGAPDAGEPETAPPDAGAGLDAGTGFDAGTCAPGSFHITAVTPVSAGATGLIASVDAEPGMTYSWSVTGGTLTSAPSGAFAGGRNVVTYTAGDAGTVWLSCASRCFTAQAAVSVIPGCPVMAFAVPSTGVSLQQVDPATGALTPAGASPTTASVPWTLAVDRSGQHLWVTQNNDSVWINEFSIAPMTSVPGTAMNTGLSCDQPFALKIDPTGSYAYWSCNFGIWGLVAAAVDGGALVPLGSGPVTPDPGNWGNPYALAIEPTSRFLYAASEFAIDAGIYKYPIAAGTGELGAPTLEATSQVYTDVVVEPTGRFLYAAVSADIDEFAIDPGTGDLTYLASTGQTDYQFAIEPGGRYLYVTSNYGIEAYSIEPGTGLLQAIPGSPFTSLSGGIAPIAVAASGTFLYVSSFTTTGTVFRIQADGSLTAATLVPTLPDLFEAAIGFYAE